MTKPKQVKNDLPSVLYINLHPDGSLNLDNAGTEEDFLSAKGDYVDEKFAVYELVGKVKLNCNPYFESID